MADLPEDLRVARDGLGVADGADHLVELVWTVAVLNLDLLDVPRH